MYPVGVGPRDPSHLFVSQTFTSTVVFERSYQSEVDSLVYTKKTIMSVYNLIEEKGRSSTVIRTVDVTVEIKDEKYKHDGVYV